LQIKSQLCRIDFTNLAIIGLIYMLEKIWLLKHEASKTIEYEKIDLIKPENAVN